MAEPDLLITAGFSDAKLAQETQKVVQKYKQMGDAAQKAFTDASGAVVDSQKLRAHMREIDRLSRAYDPVYVATKKYEGAIKQLDRALELGRIDQTKYNDELKRAQTALHNTANGIEEVGRKGIQGGTGLGNLGFQIQDFAVQVGAGTSATQAFAQQFPQLASGFGPLGIALGTVAAILVPLGGYLLSAGDGAEAMDDRLKDLEKSTDAMTAAAEAANMPLSALEARYGGLADEIQRASQASALFTAAIARRDAIATTNALGKSMGFAIPDADAAPVQWNGNVNADRQRLILRAQEGAVKRLREETGATEEQFDRLRMAINRTDSSNSLEAAVQDGENLASILTEIALSPGITDEQFRRLSSWQAQVAAVAAQTARQVEAEKSARQSLIDIYDKTTQDLAKNADEMKRAEDERAKAVAAGQTEEIALWDRIIDKINEARRATVQAALETDAAFAKMAASFPSMDEFRRGTSAEYFGAQYIAARTQGAGSRDEELVRATAAAAEQLGIATKDLLSIIMLESGGDPSIRGGAGNRHVGLIQFGPEEQRKYGASQGQSITEQMPAVVRYLMDRGVKPGMALPNVYAAVNAGQAHLTNRGDRKNGGIVDNIYEFTTGEKMKPFLNQAEGLLSAYPDIAKGAAEAAKANETFVATLDNSSRSLSQQAEAIGKSVEQAAYLAKKNELVNAAVAAGIDPATQMSEIERQAQAAGTNARLAEEVNLRKKNSDAMKQMGEQLAANLVDQSKEAELAKWAADQQAKIISSDMTDQQKAAAMAAVTAELEKQRLIYKLQADAKQRNVDLDAVMAQSAQAQIAALTGLAAGTITYRQAIDALGAAKAQQVIADQQAAAAADRLKQAQDFAAQQTQALKDGLVDAIIEGENFADVLANVAQALAKAALQAALFGEGPFAGNGGGGLLGNIFSGGLGAIFGGARAMGGPVSAGSAYLVGERGPEIIVPPSAGHVIPNHKLGGSTFAPQTSIVIQGNADERTIAMMRHELDARDRRLEKLMPSRVAQHNRDPLRR